MESLDRYFCARGRVDVRPVEGVHYTTDTLRTMLPCSVADRIVREIVLRMPVVAKPFLVFETGAGLGGLTVALASNNNVRGVYAFEKDSRLHKMLTATLEAYQVTNKAIAVNQPFTGVPREYAGAVLISTSPVLEKNWKKWLNTNVALALIRVPNGEYEYETVMKVDDNTSFILYTNEKGMKAAVDKGTQYFAQLTEIRLQEMNSEQWMEGFTQMIERTLDMFLPASVSREPYFTPESLATWVQAFTHESFDRFTNYEDLEILGDRELEFTFTKYLLSRFPGINKSEITQLKRAYLSRKEHNKQQTYSRELGFGPYIRYIGLVLTDSVLEDVFEAFIGALDQISDSIKPGLGFVNALNFISAFFDKQGIDRTLATEGDKSLVYERFKQFGWDRPIEEDEEVPGGVRVTVKLSPRALEYLARRGLRDISPIIGEAEGRNKIPAFKEAYAQALRKIESWGLNEEKLREEREKMQLHDRAKQPYLPIVRRKLKQAGFIDFEFYEPKNITTIGSGVLVELFGVTTNEERQLLRAAIGENRNEAELLLLAGYAKSE